MNHNEQRNWLANKLDTKRVPDEVWDVLVEERMVTDNPSEADLNDLASDAARLLKAWRGGAYSSRGWRPGRPKGGLDISEWLDDVESERRRVFAECVAKMANQHPDVQSFREETLEGRWPLTYEEALDLVREDGIIRAKSERYSRAALEDLDKLTEKLNKTYCWREENASWFVLVGHVPPLDTFRIKTSSTYRPFGPKVVTITLTVEPWLPAEKVKRIYSDIQRQILGQSNRRVSRRSLKLLRFVEKAKSSGKSSWRGLMERWNDTYPEWKFAIKNLDRDDDNAVREFQKTYQRTYKRVIDPDYTLLPRTKWSISGEERGERLRRAAAPKERTG